MIHNIFLVLSFLTATSTLAQRAGNSPPGPTTVDCQPRLLPLAPCGAFVQGTVPLPAQQCCSNFRALYNQQRSCLCLLLNATTLSSLPINTTLALQLPALCGVQVNTSACPAPLGNSHQPVPLQPSTPKVSFGAESNSTAAASPMVTVGPRNPGLVGFGFHHHSSSRVNSKVNDYSIHQLDSGILDLDIFQ